MQQKKQMPPAKWQHTCLHSHQTALKLLNIYMYIYVEREREKEIDRYRYVNKVIISLLTNDIFPFVMFLWLVLREKKKLFCIDNISSWWFWAEVLSIMENKWICCTIPKSHSDHNFVSSRRTSVWNEKSFVLQICCCVLAGILLQQLNQVQSSVRFVLQMTESQQEKVLHKLRLLIISSTGRIGRDKTTFL